MLPAGCHPGKPARSAANPFHGHETRGALGHAAAPAARAEAAALAGKGHEPLEGAVPTAEPLKAMRQHAAREEISELLLHELRQPVAIGVMRRRV